MQTFNDTFNDFLATLSSWLWGWPMIVLLLGTHVFLTIRLRFPQRHLLRAIRLSVSKDRQSAGDVSQFAALTTALAATIGTGNIVGVGTAIALGGPGAVFWCWLTGVLGISTKYGEALLAVRYRVRTPDGRMLGGPMYALERGLAWNSRGWKRRVWQMLALAFAFFTATAAFGIGSTVQANSISVMGTQVFGVEPVVVGGVVTILSAAVIMGGVRSIARFCMALVPLMAAFYILGCLTILVMNAPYVVPAVKLIVASALDPSAVGGGMAGSSVMLAARYGIARGLFSNESGLGSAPIVAAAAQTRNPVRQALVSSSGTFWDTVVICAMTGLVIVSSILAYPDIDYSHGATLTKMAFSKIPYFGTPMLAFGVVTFAFSTAIGWCYYGEKAVEYLSGKKTMIAYRIVYLLSVFFGSIINLTLVWNIADCMNALMAIPNLLSLIFLSGIIVKETKKYLWNNKLDEYGE